MGVTLAELMENILHDMVTLSKIRGLQKEIDDLKKTMNYYKDNNEVE